MILTHLSLLLICWGDRMKKKYLIVLYILISFIVSGCTVDYNLDFTDYELKETININLDSIENNEKNIESMRYSAEYESAAISMNGIIKRYNFTENQNKDSYIGTFEYNYSIEDFNKAHLIRSCYDSFNFVKTEKGYQFVTSNVFKCGTYSYMPVDKYIFTVTTNHKVIESNADKIEKNKYIWEIDTNGEVNINKPIKIVFSNETAMELLSENLLDNSKLVTYIVLGVLSCAIIVVTIVFVVKSKRNGN